MRDWIRVIWRFVNGPTLNSPTFGPPWASDPRPVLIA